MQSSMKWYGRSFASLASLKQTDPASAFAIRKQPTCKKGTTKWSYTGVVPRHDVFYTLFGFEEPKTKSKMRKQKKLEMRDFEKAIGCISVSVRPVLTLPRRCLVMGLMSCSHCQIRYGLLSVTGQTVMLHWDAENSQFTLKGTYGLPY